MKKATVLVAMALVLASLAALPAGAESSDDGRVCFELINGVPSYECPDEPVAEAEEVEEEDPESLVAEDELSLWFDDETGELTFGIGLDCAPTDEVEGEEAAGESVASETEEESELVVSECNTISVVGPSGKVNHGSVVSAFVHALKNSDVDGPKGQLVSQVAKTDFGKVGDDSPAESEDLDDGPKAEKAKNANKPAKPEKSNNGKAKGKNKNK